MFGKLPGAQLQDAGSLGRLLERQGVGIEWVVFLLMGGEDRPQRYIDWHRYIFGVHGSVFTLCDEYSALLTRVAVTQESIMDVPRGSHYSIENAFDAVPVMLIFYKAAHAGQLEGQNNAGSRQKEGQQCHSK